jgi:sugar/nucleoside kinase (ribokinase family)
VPRTDLLTVGEAFQDLVFVGLPHLPRSGEELRTQQFVSTIGGGAVITATAASRLGLRTTIVSALSGEAARTLRAESVRVVNVKRPAEAHAITVALSTKRDRSFVTFDGVNDRLETRLPAAIARLGARHVHFAFAPRECGRWTRRLERLRARGVTTSWDFGWNPPLRGTAGFAALVAAVDVMFLNEAEAALYAPTRPSAPPFAFWRRTARTTIIKLGPRGSRWIGGGRNGLDVTVPAPRVRAVDTTGAGDAFNGGFLSAWLDGQPPRECLRLGNFVGAQSTLAPGGIASLPRQSSTRLTRPAWPTRPTSPTRPRSGRS